MPSYDIMYHVYNGEEEPSHRFRVTLSHFYGRLGKDLRLWKHWAAFVDGFHPRLFRLSGVGRGEILANPGSLAIFSERLSDIRDARTDSGVSFGQADLVESEAKVRKRHEEVKEKGNQFKERTKQARESTNVKLQEYFPELQGLPR
ncbi:hypothetical protein [Fimbriiglobus ruber]|uniref:hypothetical protein n=1 Tax=Fimbriiglobus ruber TaxID=1908690 RepID=UPI0013796FA9|nr:hypothetical protein [Fimbriiglobus ruber]